MTADQPQLPGWCWRCLGRGVITVAATAIDRHGDIHCIEELVRCPDCRLDQMMASRRSSE